MASDDAGDAQEPRDKDVAAREREPEDTLRAKLAAIIPDLVRRTFSAGLGAVASTEDGLRRLTRALQIPNVAGYLADTADTTKDKVLEIIAREVREFLAHVNVSDEIAKMLTKLSFEIKTEIRFIPNSERYTGVEPDVKAAVRAALGEDEAPAGSSETEASVAYVVLVAGKTAWGAGPVVRYDAADADDFQRVTVGGYWGEPDARARLLAHYEWFEDDAGAHDGRVTAEVIVRF